MDVMLLGMITEVKALQPSKAFEPMDVTVLGMTTEVKPVPAQTPSSIVVIPSGKVKEVKL